MEWIRRNIMCSSGGEFIELGNLRCEPTVQQMKEMLWKKDSDGNFIDFGDFEINAQQKVELDSKYGACNPDMGGKNNEKSIKLRKKGNTLVCPLKALDCYNHSLRLAENESKHVALAYSNRAACFYEMGFYDEASEDISRVREAQLPEHLQTKLKLLSSDVKVGQSKHAPFEPKPHKNRMNLSYVQNKNYPCLADVVKIKESEKYGRYLRSKYKLKANDMILIEKDYLRTVDDLNGGIRTCTTCFAEDKNFIACPQCTDAMFCDENCRRESPIHSWECNTFITTIEFDLKLPIHSVLMAFDLFTCNDKIDTKALINHVKQMLKTMDKLPESTHDSTSKYEFFFKMSKCTVSEKLISYKLKSHEAVYVIEKLLLKIPKIAEAFQNRRDRVFLMHLILHHCLIIKTNGFGSAHSSKLGLVQSLFNHSCQFNTAHISIQNESFYWIKKKVKRNDQLYISYVNVNLPTELRKRRLETWGFVCSCNLCAPNSQNKCLKKINAILYRFDDDDDNDDYNNVE
ncbi:SET and MYND domain-containing protein DDB_G0273589-like [Contarinia nasturtii]|uniref:SET and MYND domain-containing protein DDB_G0273589-like n=1 Tax=Contarinia nasturtii TaxID=265458 RepID=UPI0012D3BF44|nr:SET and MYND domain-containing protein DDB_G0273589-like [Contarinia nasturtii]